MFVADFFPPSLGDIAVAASRYSGYGKHLEIHPTIQEKKILKYVSWLLEYLLNSLINHENLPPLPQTKITNRSWENNPKNFLIRNRKPLNFSNLLFDQF